MRALLLPLGWLAGLALMAAGGCVQPWTARLAPPDRHILVRDPLVIHSDFPLPANHRLVADLAALRRDLRQRVGLPVSDEPIHVYLFESGDRFRAFVRLYYPDFPDRRAFFLETDTRLQIYAHWGDRVGEDLRHEATHGYLHSTVPNLPLWLDEGIAEFYEVPLGGRGLNRANLEYLVSGLERGEWQPDLTRLERLQPGDTMRQSEYAEAWAWVHFLLESSPEHRAALLQYLTDLRRRGSTEPLSARLGRLLADPGAALVAHLSAVAAGQGVRPLSP